MILYQFGFEKYNPSARIGAVARVASAALFAFNLSLFIALSPSRAVGSSEAWTATIADRNGLSNTSSFVLDTDSVIFTYASRASGQIVGEAHGRIPFTSINGIRMVGTIGVVEQSTNPYRFKSFPAFRCIISFRPLSVPMKAYGNVGGAAPFLGAAVTFSSAEPARTCVDAIAKATGKPTFTDRWNGRRTAGS